MLREIEEEGAYDRLFWVIKSQKLADSKFNGILNDFDLNKCTLEAILHSISVGVYLEEEDQGNLQIYIEHEMFFIENSEEWEFGNEMVLNNKSYCQNYDIPTELYREIEYAIVKVFRYELKEDIASIVSSLNGFFNNENRIEYLNKKHLECWSSANTPSQFLLYMGTSNDYENWQDYFTMIISERTDLTKEYLSRSKYGNFKIERDYFYNEIKDWVYYYRLKNIIDFCVLKIDELQNENLNGEIEKPNLSTLIFKNDGLKIFDFIVLKYTLKKDRAFFSYLYYFLQAEKKINLYTKDNIIYREYVLDKFSYLKTFSRVISSNAENQYKKTDVEDNFKNILKSYSETN